MGVQCGGNNDKNTRKNPPLDNPIISPAVEASFNKGMEQLTKDLKLNVNENASSQEQLKELKNRIKTLQDKDLSKLNNVTSLNNDIKTIEKGTKDYLSKHPEGKVLSKQLEETKQILAKKAFETMNKAHFSFPKSIKNNDYTPVESTVDQFIKKYKSVDSPDSKDCKTYHNSTRIASIYNSFRLLHYINALKENPVLSKASSKFHGLKFQHYYSEGVINVIMKADWGTNIWGNKKSTPKAIHKLLSYELNSFEKLANQILTLKASNEKEKAFVAQLLKKTEKTKVAAKTHLNKNDYKKFEAVVAHLKTISA